MNNKNKFEDALNVSAKKPVIKTPVTLEEDDQVIFKTLKEKGFSSFHEMELSDIDDVFEHFLKAFQKEKLTLYQFSLFAESLFNSTNDWGVIINEAKYGQLIFDVAACGYYLENDIDSPFLNMIRENLEELATR